MKNRNKYKITGQMSRQKADAQANVSVFLFFPNARFLKPILARRTNCKFTS